MERLPPVEEQEWLLDCLRMLVRRRGASSFLDSGLLGDDRLGPWSPDTEGVARTGRILLDHAGLHDVELRVTPAPVSSVAGPVALYHRGAPLYLVSFSMGLAHVAVAPDLYVDRRVAAGLLAHELSHVWRGHHGLEVVEPDLEERLTDLSSVYLGFGILTANLAARTRDPRLAEQRSAYASVAPFSGGVAGLGLESLAFLLAGQVLARRSGCLATCGVARRLEPEARRSFGDALRTVRALPGGLPWRLRLPGHDTPAAPRLPRRARPPTPEPSPVGDDHDDGAR